MTTDAGKTRARDIGSGKVPTLAVSVTATALNPAAPAAYSAHASGATAVVSNAATDLDTTAAALEALRDEVALYELQISALILDVAALRAELVAMNIVAA